jgi:hypothetical protein
MYGFLDTFVIMTDLSSPLQLLLLEALDPPFKNFGIRLPARRFIIQHKICSFRCKSVPVWLFSM